MHRDLRDLTDPLVVLAFSGWNDAGSAASDTVAHLDTLAEAREVFALDSEDYYDFQVNRPTVSRPVPNEAVLTWPRTVFRAGAIGDRDVLLITGPEPNLRWKSFSTAIVSALRSVRPSLVVLIGALLADTPHTRPIPVSKSASSDEMIEKYGAERNSYEGPTGIIGILNGACETAGLETISLWAAVPHYVSSSPNPKAILALVKRLEDVTGLHLGYGDLPELSRAWERGVNQLIEDDSELSDYVSGLEADQDETELPEASGDAIAADFERYLRRHGQDPQ